jgi:hypothetical protein
MLGLLSPSVARLLWPAEPILFPARLGASALLPRAPARLLSSRPTTLGPDAGVIGSGLKCATAAQPGAFLLHVGRLYVCTTGLVRARRFGPLSILVERVRLRFFDSPRAIVVRAFLLRSHIRSS